MRKDLVPYAEQAAAASYGESHRFWYLYGRKLVVPGLVVGVVVMAVVWVRSVGVGTAVGYLAGAGMAVGAVLVLVGLVVGNFRRGPRLPGGRRPPRLPPGL